MGDNKMGQLGLSQNNLQQLSSPEIVEALSMWAAKKISCSKDSTFALMESGELMCWGSCKHGVLGLGDCAEDQFFPIKVIVDFSCDDQIEIVDISAGKNHVGIICRKNAEVDNSGEETGSNCLYMWGSNKYGQLGLWDFNSRNTPSFVDSEFDPVSIECGHTFSIAQSHHNGVYSSGSNLQGQLGQSQSLNKINVFSQISNLPLQDIQKICASDYASCLLSNGDFYLWGPTPVGQFNSPQLF